MRVINSSHQIALTVLLVVGVVSLSALAQQEGRSGGSVASGSQNPIVADYGSVHSFPNAAAQPRDGSRIVVDVTRGGEPAVLNSAFEKVARYVNIYGGAGKEPADVSIVVVLHGSATLSVLNDVAYSKAFQIEGNPNLECLRDLSEAGVTFLVCGQSLTGKGHRPEEVSEVATTAVSALTALVNHQADGYSYIPLLE